MPLFLIPASWHVTTHNHNHNHQQGMMQLLAFWGRYAVAYCGLRSIYTEEDQTSSGRYVQGLGGLGCVK